MHYLIAKYAPAHPNLYLDHWGKPFFTLIASPFARFGIAGIIVFNLLSLSAASFLTGLTALKLNFKYPLLTILTVSFAPFVFLIALSGLTEPFSAFILSLALYLIVSKKWITASLLISFLPFCRSEGLILMTGFAIYFLHHRKWLSFALLSTGHIIYSIVGFFAGKTIFWVLTEIPYANLASMYGSGNWSHFFIQLQYIIGIPLYFLLIVGFFAMLIHLIFRKIRFSSVEFLLIWLPFFLFFLFHTIAWATGTFSSMGLKRVFVTVIPLIALITARGSEIIMQIPIPTRIKNIVAGVFLVYIIAFPFLPNPAAFIFPCDFRPHADLVLMNCVGKTEAAKNVKTFYSAHPQLAIATQTDIFNREVWKPLYNDTGTGELIFTPGSLIIWDEWFAVIEHGIPLASLKNNPNLQFIGEYSISFCNTSGHIAIFKPKDQPDALKR